jgi:6-phosphogluconolactonase
MRLPLRAVAVFTLALACLVHASAAERPPAGPQAYHVYFGTYTKAPSKGIYRALLDPATGKLSPAELAAECRNPSFLAVHPNGRVLYAIDESSDPAKHPGKGVAAYAIDATSGRLSLLNEQSNGGPGPCHLAVDRDGRALVIANYSGGSVAAIALQTDGRLGAPGSVIQHAGSSVNPARQKGPHAHVVTVAPGNRHVLCADLGLDQVLVYQFDATRATLRANDPAFVRLPAGAGPRHLAFHPGGRYLYAINELLCTMAVFDFDAARGGLKEVQLISTLPPGETVKPGFSTAEVAVHPSGKFLYGSNRGHNTIVVYAIDATNGRITHVANTPTGGKTPRHFALDPAGAWLLAENQDSDTVVVFRIDPNSGRLTPTGQSLAVPSPVCAVFVVAK